MLMLCVSWGFNQIAVKLAFARHSAMLQATIRSSGALIVLFVIARLARRENVWSATARCAPDCSPA